MTAQAGWYPTPRPERAGLMEYWDGHRWTEQFSTPAPPQIRYQYKTVTTNAAMVRLLKKGWEVVNSSGRQNWFWGSDLKVVMRRPV